MFARLVSGQATEGKLDELARIWREEDMPLMDSVRGYLGHIYWRIVGPAMPSP